MEDYFDVPDNFDFQEWANKSFGVFQGDEMNVKLKFTDTAIEDAKNYHFHPTQKVTVQKDCVIVEFKACGAEAICWELFKWGTAVEILEPAELKERYVDKLNSILEKTQKTNTSKIDVPIYYNKNMVSDSLYTTLNKLG